MNSLPRLYPFVMVSLRNSDNEDFFSFISHLMLVDSSRSFSSYYKLKTEKISVPIDNKSLVSIIMLFPIFLTEVLMRSIAKLGQFPFRMQETEATLLFPHLLLLIPMKKFFNEGIQILHNPSIDYILFP